MYTKFKPPTNQYSSSGIYRRKREGTPERGEERSRDGEGRKKEWGIGKMRSGKGRNSKG